MHHLVLERWSRGQSPLHARDARVKLVLVLAFLAAVATTPRLSPAAGCSYAAILLAAALLARLPAGPVLMRAAVVMPFALSFAAAAWIAGDGDRAFLLVVKSYISSLAVLLLVATTPLPQLLRGLESLGTPRFLILVVQFLYRYLFVVSEQAQHMRLAAACRGGFAGPGRAGFKAAGGAVAVLFARSYDRASGIHNAMLARGYQGRLGLLSTPSLAPMDFLLLIAGIVLLVGVRLW